MNKISNAIILAAGLGERLKPITEEIPKCMTEVNGISILENALKVLSNNDIKKTVIVIGYLGEKIIDAFKEQYGDMKIIYRWNNDYKTTNSMYSLWLARDFLEEGTYLIEGDVFFSSTFFEVVQQLRVNKSYWIVDQFYSYCDGSMSITDSEGRIVEVKIVKGKLEKCQDNFFKSSGILKLNFEFGVKFSSWLSEEIRINNTNVYYDLVIAKHINDIPIYVHYVENKEWVEIDDLYDLRRAEKKFQ